MLDFQIKALFSSYGIICSPWMLLRAAQDPFNNNSEDAHGRLLLKLIRQLIESAEVTADHLTKLTYAYLQYFNTPTR